MSKKRVHEIAKEHGLSSKELLEKLHAAGIEAKAAASSVEEAAALKALGASDGAAPSSNGSSRAGAVRRRERSGRKRRSACRDAAPGQARRDGQDTAAGADAERRPPSPRRRHRQPRLPLPHRR